MNKKEFFRQAIERIVARGKFNPALPQATFIKSLIEFRRTWPGGLYLKNSPVSEYNNWEKLFLQIVAEMGLTLAPNSLGRRSVVTPATRRGAYGAELRHRGVLKYNDN